MRTDYNTIAAEYKKSKQQPWRTYIEHFTLFELIGDLGGKSVLDLACGEGFYTRFLKKGGAARTVGVDLSERMIDLAKAEEARQPLGIDYLARDAKTLELPDKFDLVVAGYLLNYAATKDELLAMGQAIARHLKPGCRFVTVNNNPIWPPQPVCYKQYGFDRKVAGPLTEGAPVIWSIFLDDKSFDITNYHLSIATHESTFKAAGFREVRWHPARVATAGEAELGKEHWKLFLNHPPVTFIECER
jgi:ubiquinone/menaquinone biosynthesis C-methylase UbiE